MDYHNAFALDEENMFVGYFHFRSVIEYILNESKKLSCRADRHSLSFTLTFIH